MRSFPIVVVIRALQALYVETTVPLSYPSPTRLQVTSEPTARCGSAPLTREFRFHPYRAQRTDSIGDCKTV